MPLAWCVPHLSAWSLDPARALRHSGGDQTDMTRFGGGGAMSEQDTARGVSGHYGRTHLVAAILEALRAAGKGLDTLTLDDLAPVDQFHSRGKAATLELARLAELRGRERVLDVGGGIGGGARTLATEYGCT